jgi:hypothetical protein
LPFFFCFIISITSSQRPSDRFESLAWRRCLSPKDAAKVLLLDREHIRLLVDSSSRADKFLGQQGSVVPASIVCAECRVYPLSPERPDRTSLLERRHA